MFYSAFMKFVVCVYCVVPMVCALLAVGFYTLVERKILGYIQNRKGPAKVSYMGIFQPFSDAGKLFTKEYVIPWNANWHLFWASPIIILVTRLLLWTLYPCKYYDVIFVCGLLQYLAISSFSTYGIVLAGWRSNSKYAILGAVRALAQRISYEVPITLIMIFVVLSRKSFWSKELIELKEDVALNLLFDCIAVFVWRICMLAETNRSPFDFVEGESELVSGFNVEYRRGGFAMIFIAEYRAILFNRIFAGVLFSGGPELHLRLVALMFSFVFLWCRGTLPRMRYDKIMRLCWTTLLIVSLILIIILLVTVFSH